jgi:pimeloyl-ACP methyl ester carboxylesterase
VAPDLPGFGFSQSPPRSRFQYTFDNLAKVIDGFAEVIGLKCYAIYVFDYGAPMGFRLAVAHPERVTAIVSQNGNAYEEGLSDAWDPIRRYWAEPTAENRNDVYKVVREGHVDPLKEFTEACREELKVMLKHL